MTPTQERRLLGAFAVLADTLVEGFDLVELMQQLVDTCQDVLDIAAAGLLLSDGGGRLELVASTSEEARLVELMQLSADDGPCIEAYRTGAAVPLPDIKTAPDRWKQFRDSALGQGFASVYAIPLRLRDTTIGALNLFRDVPGPFDESDARAARALANVATIGILQERAHREQDQVREQLQVALNSRVVIEQAKGILAYTHGLSMEEAFERLRQHSRANRLPLAEVARGLVERRLLF